MKNCKRFCLSLFCFSPCPGLPTSVTPKIIIIFFLYIIFTAEFLISLDVLPVPEKLITFCEREEGTQNAYEYLCTNFLPILFIYRISFAIYFLLAFMVIITHPIKSSREDLAPVHNACWMLKFVFVVGLCIACLQIPPGSFDYVFVYFGAIHSVTFSVFEFSTFLKVTYKCICKLLDRGRIIYYVPLVLVEGTMVGGPLFYLAFLFRNVVLNVDETTLFSVTIANVGVSYLLLFCHLIVVCVQRWKCGMLNGGLLCSQVTYFTSLAVFHFPNHKQLDDINENFFDIVNFFGVGIALISVILFSIVDVYKPIKLPNVVIYVEERGNELCKVWGKIRLVRVLMPPPPPSSPSPVEIPKPTGPVSVIPEPNRFVKFLKYWASNCICCPFLNDMVHTGERKSYQFHYAFTSVNENDDEYNRAKYKWRDFYIVCNHLTMYMMMSLTKWTQPYSENGKLFFKNRNIVSMWANLASCWCCCIAFIAFIFLPKYYQ